MADEIHEVHETVTAEPRVEPVAAAPVTPVTRTTAVREHTRAKAGFKIELLVYYLTGIVIALLAFRFVLSLLGANRDNAFAQLIYGLTAPMLAPFFGLFGHTFQYGVAQFEIETIVAMVVYGLVGWGIAKLIRIARA